MSQYHYWLQFGYDGSGLKGYAKQPHYHTVQATLEQLLTKLFLTPIRLAVASRTDQKVHALKNAAHFYSPVFVPTRQVQRFLNKALLQMQVHTVQLLPTINKPFQLIVSKTYLYVVNSQKEWLLANYQHTLTKPMNLTQMQQALACFEGTHNFASFSIGVNKNPYCRINWTKVYQIGTKYFLLINGNRFLQGMVRMIVAQVLLANQKEHQLAIINNLLTNPMKGSAKLLAPPQGLYLVTHHFRNRQELCSELRNDLV